MLNELCRRRHRPLAQRHEEVFACVGAALRTSPRSTIDTTIALAWGSMTLASALLIASRGHERKLNGSFTAQTTWMRMNKEALIESHKLRTSERQRT